MNAVAQFREKELFQFFYAADNLDSTKWDKRSLGNDERLSEKEKIKIVGKGSMRGQGIGYLKDGTMVVVDKAANKVGKELTVEFVKFHETSAGKMIFARIARK